MNAAHLIWMIGVALACPLGAAACRLEAVGETPARLTDEGIVVDADVNGTPVLFRLDTSSAVTLISRATAERLGLARSPIRDPERYLVEGADRMQRTRIDTLKIGAMAGGRMNLLIAERLAARDEPGGLLGEDVVSRFDVEIDLGHHRVRFFKPSACPDGQLPYWATDRYSRASLGAPTDYNEGVFTTARLNGQPVTAIVSTGAPTSVVKSSFAGSLETGPGFGGGAFASPWVGLFDTVTIGDETIHHARIRLVDQREFDRMTEFGSRAGPAANADTGMIIGADFFRSHRALISHARAVMVFTYDGDGVFQGRDAGAAP